MSLYQNQSDQFITKGDVNSSSGRDLWTKHLNGFSELVENCRLRKEGDRQDLFNCLQNIRKGDASILSLASINKQLCFTKEDALRKADCRALWLCPTKAQVKNINKFRFEKLVEKENVDYFRIVATHSPSNQFHATPDLETRVY
jgi:hypothetical protein